MLVAVYAGAGFWLVPKLVRSQAQDFVSENYQRTLSVGEIRFNPFTFELEVKDVSLPDADGQVLASFDRLLVNLELSSIWRAGASFKEISIDRPLGRVLIRANGDLNLADLFKPFPEKPGDPAKPDEPPRLFIDRFRMTEGHLSFTDRTLAKPYTADLQPLTFDLRDFSTMPGSDNAYDLHAEAGSGASLDWSGNLSLAPLASQGRFKFSHINAKAHWAYLRETAGLEVSSGVLGFDGDYDLFIGKAGTELKVGLRELGIDDIGIRPIGEDVDTARFANLTLSNASLDLARHTIGLEKVRVTGGSAQVWREANGDINLMQFTSSAKSAAPPADPKSPWLVTAPDIELSGLVVQVEDRQVKPAIKLMLDPFHVRVIGFSTAPGTTIGIVTDTKIDKAASLEADLKYGRDDGRLEGKAKLASFDITVIQPYLDRYTKMDLLSGHLTADLNVLLLRDGGLATDGVVEVHKFRTVDKAQQEDFLRWDLLRVEGFRYDGRTGLLRVKHLKTRGAYARVIIAKNETTNVAEIFTPAKPAPAYEASIQYAAAEGPPPAETQIQIDTVSFDNGSLNFADFWIQPNYAVSIASLQGTVVGLSTDPDSRAKLDLEGKVDRYAPATIDGEMNLLSATLYTNIRFRFAGVDMTSVTPYSGHFAGYEIEKGKLSIDVTYHVENRALDAKQKFVIDQLQLGDKVESPDAVSLPLKLAVALLKDKNGVIDIDLPMTGSLDDPKFRLGPLIWKAFVGLLAKIATAPFALIGKLFGGGPELSYVEFDAGATALDPASQEKMATLAKALVDRPSLQVDVPMAYSVELDGDLLAKQSLDASLNKLAASQRKLLGGRPDAEVVTAMLADPEQRFELLAKQYRAEDGEKAQLPGEAATFEALKKKERTPEHLAAANQSIEAALLEKHPVTTEQLEALGRARAQSIQEALLGGGQVDPGRVFLIHADSQPPGEGKIKLELSLK